MRLFAIDALWRAMWMVRIEAPKRDRVTMYAVDRVWC